jgi:hypothetical protein
LGTGSPELDDPRLLGLGEPARHWIRGEIEGLLVANSPTWPADRIVVADASRYLQYHQTTVEPENELLVVAIRFYDSDEAIDLVKQHPALFRTPERRARAARADELRAHGLLHVRIAFYKTITDRDAAIAIKLPKQLVSE